MNKEELNEVLSLHSEYLACNKAGARAYLRDANLRGADLSRANLRGADLSDTDLRGADLRGADLRGADLSDTDLSGADLSDTDLSGADLSRANLRDANLRGANLRRANLRGANLRGADLRRADLDYSSLPLWCGSANMIVDDRIAQQIAAHFCALNCDSDAFREARASIIKYAKQSHRAEDLNI